MSFEINQSLLAFAKLAALPVPTLDKSGGLLFKDVLLIVAAIALVTLLLFLWARLYVSRPAKKKRKRKPHRHHRNRSSKSVNQEAMDDEVDKDGDPAEAGSRSEEPDDRRHGRHRRHRRHRRRQREANEQRERHPTLAETGGLPPLRSEASSKSPE